MQIPAENRAGRVIAGFSATVRHRSILDGSEVVHRIIDEKLWQNFKEGGWGELQHFERFGRSSDDMPDEGDDHSTGGTPGLKDLFVGVDNKGARRDPIDRMAVSYTNIEEYLPLTRLTQQQLARHTRIIASLNNVNLGHSDPMHVLWYSYIGGIAINGEGRKEMVQMITADRHYQKQMAMNRFRQMGDRARNPTNMDQGE